VRGQICQSFVSRGPSSGRLRNGEERRRLPRIGLPVCWRSGRRAVSAAGAAPGLNTRVASSTKRSPPLSLSRSVTEGTALPTVGSLARERVDKPGRAASAPRAVTLGELAGAGHGAERGRAGGGARCLAPRAVGERDVVPDRAGVRPAAEAHADLLRSGPRRRARVSWGHCSTSSRRGGFRARPHELVDLHSLLEAGDGDGPLRRAGREHTPPSQSQQ
jgi:hypothetical protein